jgi:hypothetical protein
VSSTELRCIAPPLPTDALDAGPVASVGVVARAVAVSVSINAADFVSATGAPGAGMVAYTRNVVCIHRPEGPGSGTGRGEERERGEDSGRRRPRVAIVTVPKAFRGAASASQDAALRSWTSLRPRVEILLASRDEGVADAAERFGAQHLSGVAVNELGTPLLNSVLAQAEVATAADVLVLVNADILLFDDLLAAIDRMSGVFGEFLMIGRRSNMNATLTSLAHDAAAAASFRRLRRLARAHAAQHSRWALDYFIMTRGILGAHVPAFAFGRPAYDNWIVRHVR